MSDRDSLMAAILADPADDLHRLAYADWLEEHGDPQANRRAELIRLQIELHREEPGYVLDWSQDVAKIHDGSANPKIRRAADLCRWAYLADDPLWRSMSSRDMKHSWTRGFLSRIRCLADGWLKHGKELVRQQPLERVELHDKWAARMGGGFCWARPGPFARPLLMSMFLPPALWGLLPGEPMPAEDRLEDWKSYPTKEASEDALSAACLAYATAETLSGEIVR